ncbi:hypothetical protein [Amycolatopsis kentuckyensis]|uniref:hypothetical protein n=1 Tax=Amycolatopsis kentuckyensis TaxID=218823 RepID=UPI000A3B8A49|nr:hypothetical protein [Amycolatopsis kentuckyensis]
MPSGQVSVWVPIVVGIIGLLGVVTGQLINSRREDRRWEREAAREELRHRRENERLAAERAHAITLHWSQERKDAYAGLLKEADDYLRTLLKYVEALEHKGPTGEFLTLMSKHAQAAGSFHAVVDILASPLIRAAADELARATVGARITVTSDGVDGHSRGVALREAERARDAFLGEVRAELGVDTPAERPGPADADR